nr:MAG TPA: tail protein [Caudoviricetes sp.]
MLTVRWEDPNGKVWNLTTGAQGVKLDMNNSNFMGEFSYNYDESGVKIRGVKYGKIEPTLAIQINPDLSSTAWYNLHMEWWNRANSVLKDGKLFIDRPDGSTVYIDARLAKVPGTSFPYDPGMGFAEPPIEPWMLTSNFSHWWSTLVYQWQFSNGTAVGYTEGAIVSGDELQLTKTLNNVDLEVLKSAPLYPTYAFRNIKKTPSKTEFGAKGSLMQITNKAKGLTGYLRIDTDPILRRVLAQGAPVWGYVSGPMAPLSDDMRVILPKDLADDVLIQLRKRYATPF